LRIVKATISQVISLFVSDWTQTLGIAVVLLVGYLAALNRVPSPVVGYAVAFLLAAHLIFTTVSDAHKHLATRPATGEGGR
jgi:type III secretory pathway component EscR